VSSSRLRQDPVEVLVSENWIVIMSR